MLTCTYYVSSFIEGVCVPILLLKKYATIQIKAQKLEEMVWPNDVTPW